MRIGSACSQDRSIFSKTARVSLRRPSLRRQLAGHEDELYPPDSGERGLFEGAAPSGVTIVLFITSSPLTGIVRRHE